MSKKKVWLGKNVRLTDKFKSAGHKSEDNFLRKGDEVPEGALSDKALKAAEKRGDYGELKEGDKAKGPKVPGQESKSHKAPKAEKASK